MPEDAGKVHSVQEFGMAIRSAGDGRRWILLKCLLFFTGRGWNLSSQLEPEGVLWLVPTAWERDRLLARWSQVDSGPPPSFQLCGFGPIAAAAVTASLIPAVRPARVCLVGLAGTYDDAALAIGTAIGVSTVQSDVVGAEWRDQERSEIGGWELSWEMGFAELPSIEAAVVSGRGAAVDSRAVDSNAGANSLGAGGRVTGATGSSLSSEATTLRLEVTGDGPSVGGLTVGVASGTTATAARRRDRFPAVLLEDMETYGVALACRWAGVPCRVYRGVSNRVGDRCFAHWRTEEAFASLIEVIRAARS